MKKTMAIVMAVMLASLLFVFVQALRIHVAFNLPERILQMLPYLLTLAPPEGDRGVLPIHALSKAGSGFLCGTEEGGRCGGAGPAE